MGQNIPNSLNGSDFQIAIWQMNGIQCFVCVRHLSRSIKLTQCNGNLYGGNINSNCHQFVLASFILYRARQWSVVFHSMRRLNNNHRRSLSDLFFHILLGDFVVVDGIFFNVSNRETTFTWHRCKPFHICTTKYWHYRSIVRYNMEQKQTCVPSLDSLYRGESWKKNYFERITQHMSNFVTQALYRFGSIKTDCLSMAKRWVGIIKYRHIYISSNTQAKEEAWQREKEQAIIVIVSSLSYNNSKSYSNTVTTNYIDEWLPCN